MSPCAERAVEAGRPSRGMLVVTRHCPPEMRARSGWSVDQFAMAKKLGGGYASTVHLAICRATGIQVAVKVYHRVKLSQLNHYQVRREIRIHAALDHPNILRLYAAFEDDAGVYLVTEYASRGDVFGELDRRGGTMTEGDAVRQVLAPFMSALRYLHALNVIHRDIKPENLLISASGDLKVGDFGLSIDTARERPVTRVGTLDYMAPEVVVCPDKATTAAAAAPAAAAAGSPSRGGGAARQQHHYTHLVDAWAVGVLAYELTVGRAPFDAGNKRATIDQILNGQPTYPSWLSEQARHFIAWSLTKDARARPDVPQLAYHPWVTGHAARLPRPRLSGLRAAASVADLQLLPGAAGAGHAHMEARHKALVSGHVGAPSGLLGSSDGEESSEGADDATAAAGPAVAAAAAASSSSSSAAAVSAFAPAAAARGAPAGPDALRAYVSRCASANNLEALRAAVLAQPPEPSNSCFEPGGRFYTPRSSAAAPQRVHASAHAASGSSSSSSSTVTGLVKGPAPAAPNAPTITVTVTLPPSAAAGATGGSAAGAPEAAASAAPSGSPRPVRTPPPPPRPPALQIARAQSSGPALDAAIAAAAPPPAPLPRLGLAPAPCVAAAAGPVVKQALPVTPAATAAAGLAGAPPPTPDPGAPPRVQLFATASKGGAAAAAGPSPLRAPRGGSGDSVSSEAAPQPCPESSVSDGSCSRRGSCSGAGDRASASSGSGASTAASASAGGGDGGGASAPGSSALSPPEPVSPPHHSTAERSKQPLPAAAAAAGSAALGVLSRLTGGGAPSLAAGAATDGGSTAASAGGSSGSGAGWWPTLPPCVNFLRPARG